MFLGFIFFACGALWLLSTFSKSRGIVLKAQGRPSIKYTVFGILGKTFVFSIFLLTLWVLKKIFVMNMVMFLAGFALLAVGFFIFKKKVLDKNVSEENKRLSG